MGHFSPPGSQQQYRYEARARVTEQSIVPSRGAIEREEKTLFSQDRKSKNPESKDRKKEKWQKKRNFSGKF
jgi:hypothetical protein